MTTLQSRNQSVALAERLNALVPGGAHTYAKGDDQYPEGMAPVLVDGRGCRVRDADGFEYVEYAAGLRSVTLGHAEPRVVQAAVQAMRHGTNFVRPTILEAEVAEAFVNLIDATATTPRRWRCWTANAHLTAQQPHQPRQHRRVPSRRVSKSASACDITS